MRSILTGSSLGIALLLALACGSGSETTSAPPPPPLPADVTVSDPPMEEATASGTDATPAAAAPAIEDDPMGMPAGSGPVCCENDELMFAAYSETDGDCAPPTKTIRGDKCETVCCDFATSDSSGPVYEFALAGNCVAVMGPHRNGSPVEREKCLGGGDAKPAPAPAPEPSPKTSMTRPGSTSKSGDSTSTSTGTKPSASGKTMKRPR